MFLTPTDLRTLTGKTTRPAQARALDAMGIRHAVNGAGNIIVLRAHVERKLDRADARAQTRPDFTGLECV